MALATAATPIYHGKWYRHLYVQVLSAIALGVLLGHFYPSLGEPMKPLGDAFIKLIKMLIAPIIFCTVVHGIASMEDMKKVGRVGLKALIYFEVMTTVALVIGLIVVNLWQPGAGMNVDPAPSTPRRSRAYTAKAGEQSTRRLPACTSSRPPWSAPSPRARSCRCCSSRSCSPSRCRRWASAASRCCGLIDQAAHVFFGIVGFIMKVAPIGAFGAMAFTIGKYGVGTLVSLGKLMLAFYATCLLFIFVVLGLVARLCGFWILKFIRYIKEELLIVLGTCPRSRCCRA